MNAGDVDMLPPRGRKRSALLLLPVLLLALVALGAPLLAWDQPIVCRHDGRLYFPALVVAGQNVPVIGGFLRRDVPFRYPDFVARSDLDATAFALWPLIRFNPDEYTDEALSPPSRAHWLGTDDRGRDVAARMLHGSTVSLRVGIFAMLLAGALGIAVGAVAGYFGGWNDGVLSRVIEATICFPALFLILAVLAWVGRGVGAVVVVIALTQWTLVARLVRAEFLRMRGADFVTAARSYGASPLWIALRHMLPGALAPATVTLVFGVADAILIEAGLSWLDFGVPAPAASWGGMLRSAYEQMRSAPHLVWPPCVAIFVSVLACHLAGVWLRGRIDPLAK
ncbi:MAG: ABC transporter permease [Phycisphaerales bacterium]|nr:ABC transporter permease [Phycisphaerales bacterium]